MRYHALACDFDGTLAHDGKIDEPTLAALERFRATGRKLLMVTGREVDDLLRLLPEFHYFEHVVAENGAVLYDPARRVTKSLIDPPPQAFIAELRRRGVEPLAVGKGIVATFRPHEKTVLDVIRQQGLELQVIFNKGAVMVLPTAVNKASGLSALLRELNLSPHEVVGVGDAENDHAFLTLCECGVAVANAVPAVKERADFVTTGDHGKGVAELIDAIVADDMASRESGFTRRMLTLGATADGEPVVLPPYSTNLLVAGPSGGGKSTVTTSLIEHLLERHYQLCIIDPEGDYDGLEGANTVGGSDHAPGADDVIRMLETPEQNVVVNMVGMALSDRPHFFMQLLPRLFELRSRSARPHWIIVDEAHHVLPANWEPGKEALPRDPARLVFVTVQPDTLAAEALAVASHVVAVGPEPALVFDNYCQALNRPLAPRNRKPPGEGEVTLWAARSSKPPLSFTATPGKSQRRRHTRKYAEGELTPEHSFWFRGPQNKLQLRAQNLILFLQIADGVDDPTWEFHRLRGDYSKWFRERIKNSALAEEAAAVEAQKALTPAESRQLLRKAVESHYTLPATTPMPMPGTDVGLRHN